MQPISQENIQLLVKTVQELSLARDIETVMRIVRTAARNLTGADGSTFVLREGELCYYADEDAISPLWKGSRFPMSICISGWTMLNRKPAVIEDIYADERVPVDAYRPTFVKSLAMVPIRTMDPIGAIGNYWAKRRQPTEDEVWLLQSLADITAVTLENINIYAGLEQSVKNRTEQLEAANKELEAFSYSVSHDLRAPLRAIKGYSNMLMEEYHEKLDEEGQRIAKKIIRSTEKMNLLIEDLLSFFREGKKEPVKMRIAMKGMVGEVIYAVREQEKNREIEFIVNDLPDAEGDPSLLKQVWTNLLSNAVKYTRKKEKAIIEIAGERKEGQVVYRVKDNGAGFDMEYAGKLFGVFQRLHSTAEFEGSGIGLAIVQRIVARHGGRVWADGKINEGASFYFSLPLGD